MSCSKIFIHSFIGLIAVGVLGVFFCFMQQFKPNHTGLISGRNSGYFKAFSLTFTDTNHVTVSVESNIIRHEKCPNVVLAFFDPFDFAQGQSRASETRRGIDKRLANRLPLWPTYSKKDGSFMAKVIENSVRRARYISVRQGGEEVYVENISTQDALRDAVPAGKPRLREIQKIMPLGNWSLNIEEQWKGRNCETHYRIVDVMTGKIQESVL